MLSREDILALERPTADVEVEGVGLFRVRALSAAEAVALGLMWGGDDAGGVGDQIGLMLARCIVGEDNQRLFPDSEADKVAQAIPAAALMPIVDAAMKLSGFGDEDEDGKASFGEAQTGA